MSRFGAPLPIYRLIFFASWDVFRNSAAPEQRCVLIFSYISLDCTFPSTRVSCEFLWISFVPYPDCGMASTWLHVNSQVQRVFCFSTRKGSLARWGNRIDDVVYAFRYRSSAGLLVWGGSQWPSRSLVRPPLPPFRRHTLNIERTEPYFLPRISCRKGDLGWIPSVRRSFDDLKSDRVVNSLSGFEATFHL